MEEKTVKKPVFKKWWFWVIIVVVVIGVLAYPTGDDQAVDTPAELDATTVAATTKATEAEKSISVTAKDLAKAYDANEVKADKKYKDKLLKITGTVKEVTTVLDQTSVTLEGGGEFDIFSVSCYVKEDQLDKAAELSKGDKVTLLGTCDGTITGGYPSLIDVTIQ